ncbi:hypothetical protein BU23DRAFT_599438 [Bimuria novae-zelandiae CBS 107.79]|uniref:Uncharacterized protein n=1 Tax=Bimuria novae-zelandiae CBS 107.79 TaxID=1447943 RepID=A0A6A5VH74_9PLEO|nr:hypothetical protein BU23DRAFT_599438 [Bimuria novae-zelandiae CBS 107.79]
MAPSLPFTFRIGTPGVSSFEPYMPAVIPKSVFVTRDEDNTGFTGNHKLVGVLVVLALMAGILLVVFSLRQAKEQDIEAKKRGAFVDGLERRDKEAWTAAELEAPLPFLRIGTGLFIERVFRPQRARGRMGNAGQALGVAIWRYSAAAEVYASKLYDHLRNKRPCVTVVQPPPNVTFLGGNIHVPVDVAHHSFLPQISMKPIQMAVPHRYIIVASSIALILVIAISLTTSLEIRAAPRRVVQISMAQLAKDGQIEAQAQRAGANINGSAIDRADILSETSTVAADQTATWVLSVTAQPTVVSDEGMIGATPIPQPSSTSADEGFIGNMEASSVPKPTARPSPPPAPQVPIAAMSYSGDGGPKHCRGQLLQNFTLPRPASSWRNGTCVDLPARARCGVFYSAKGDNCEAQLFTMEGCYNTTETYMNTVVFMPEERPVGGMWKSMYIRCGIDAPEPALINPSILGGALKKPGSG